MSGTYKRWMMFVDGENLAIRARKLAEQSGEDLSDARRFPVYHQDVYFWPGGVQPWNHKWTARVPVHQTAERCHYYTCMTGGHDILDAARDKLKEAGFDSTIIQKPKDQRAKGVDISLTKDMLMQAVLGNYEVAVLVTGDGDYLPVVEEVKRLGKRVVLAFFEKSGLSKKLRRAADEFYPLPLTWVS